MDPLKEQIAYMVKCCALNQLQMGVDWTSPSNLRWLDFADAILALVQAREKELREALEQVDRLNHHHGSGPHCTCSQSERTRAISKALHPERRALPELMP